MVYLCTDVVAALVMETDGFEHFWLEIYFMDASDLHIC